MCFVEVKSRCGPELVARQEQDLEDDEHDVESVVESGCSTPPDSIDRDRNNRITNSHSHRNHNSNSNSNSCHVVAS